MYKHKLIHKLLDKLTISHNIKFIGVLSGLMILGLVTYILMGTLTTATPFVAVWMIGLVILNFISMTAAIYLLILIPVDKEA